MKNTSLSLLASLFLVTALGSTIACSSTTEETSAVCDPAVDQTCVADTGASGDGGDETAVTDSGAGDSASDGTLGDATGDGGGGDAGEDVAQYDSFVPTADIGGGGGFPDGSIVLADGAIKLPDGNVVGPDALTGCVAGATQCTNCIDDDKDGLLDWLDPECTGPLDNDEGSYATGIPGDNIDACKQDCWFDGNSGSGNDGCLFDLGCNEATAAAAGCAYRPNSNTCVPPSEKCVKYCKPLVPKGCDCAGCCQVFDAAGVPHTVKLEATCSTESLNDPTKCPVCTQIAECSQPCGRCDWCLGKTSLPADCYPPPPADAGTPGDASPPPDGSPPPDASPPGDAGTGPTCPDGLAVCSPTIPCATGTYCLTGCCIKPPS